MVYKVFNNGFFTFCGILPTGNQILFGIILAQVENLQDHKKRSNDYRYQIQGYSELWKKLFLMIDGLNMQ